MLESVAGVEKCTVDLDSGTATCEVDPAVDPAVLAAAVKGRYKATVQN